MAFAPLQRFFWVKEDDLRTRMPLGEEFWLAAKHKHADQEIAPLARGFQTETAGEVLSDGTVLELIRENGNTGELRLLAWDGATAKVAGYAEHKGKTYVPAALDPTILRAMRLPSRIMPYGLTRALLMKFACC